MVGVEMVEKGVWRGGGRFVCLCTGSILTLRKRVCGGRLRVARHKKAGAEGGGGAEGERKGKVAGVGGSGSWEEPCRADVAAKEGIEACSILVEQNSKKE